MSDLGAWIGHSLLRVQEANSAPPRNNNLVTRMFNKLWASLQKHAQKASKPSLMSDQTEPQSYTYRPLETPKTIRVLALLPVSAHPGSNNLWATLRHVSLEDQEHPDGLRVEYDAISYAWGKSAATNRLFTDEGAIMIRDNFFAALKTFRSRTQVRYMWADAVCINQDDPTERSQQVSIMHEVYSKAQHVRIWLGKVAMASAT